MEVNSTPTGFWGLTEWTQTDGEMEHEINNNTNIVTIIVEGVMKHGISIKGSPLYWSETHSWELKINIITGAPISIIYLD